MTWNSIDEGTGQNMIISCLLAVSCQLRTGLEQCTSTFKSACACAGGTALFLHMFIFFHIPLLLFIQPLPPSVLSAYLCQFTLPQFSRFVNDVSCTFSWPFTIFNYSFRNYLLLLGSQSLEYHYCDSLQFQISVPFHATFSLSFWCSASSFCSVRKYHNPRMFPLILFACWCLL